MKDWLLALALGAVAIPIIGGAAAGVFTTPIELTLWTVAGVGWVVAARRWGARPWAVVAGAGPVSGVIAGAMQAALLTQLIANHPAWADFTADAAGRFTAFTSALPIAIVWGLLFAGITWLIGYAQSRDPAVAS